MKSKQPQAPPFADEREMEAFLKRPLLARLGTYNEDGTIHIAPLYFLYSSGEFLFGTQDLSRKVNNIRRDRRVTVLIDAQEPVLQSVMACGEAVLDYEDVISKRVKILERYYDSPAQARAFVEKLARAWKTVIIRMTPARMVTIDYGQPFTFD